MGKFRTDHFRSRSKRLKNPTPSEALMASALERAGIQFNRETPMYGGYMADFFITAPLICVEVDGASHDSPERREKDRIRDEKTGGHGILTLRFKASEVEADPDGVAAKVSSVIAERGVRYVSSPERRAAGMAKGLRMKARALARKAALSEAKR